jgi:monoamine oxidase
MHDIIIIGAGVAGLAAGRALRDAGRPALIVEARERVGGRVSTDRTHGPVELGAEFIHGDRAATWALVRAAGLRAAPWEGPRLFGRAGRILPEDDPTVARARELYNAVSSRAGADESVASALARLAPPDDPGLPYALQWLANIEGADTSRLSAAALSREHELSSNGDDNFHILDGYDRAVAHLAAGLDIRLGSPVERVRWAPGAVTLELAGGAQLAARRALITVPLGVLQANRPAFSPALPPAKRAAIAAIPMGHVTKLVLWFDRELWPVCSAISTDGRVATWWPVESAATPTLMGYTGGLKALALAALGEAGAIEAGVAELSALLGADVRPALLGGRLADWSRDEWTLGAYSYSPVGIGDARATLAEPVADTLYFAGEATVTWGHLATVHGALESGARAAEALLLGKGTGDRGQGTGPPQ